MKRPQAQTFPVPPTGAGLCVCLIHSKNHAKMPPRRLLCHVVEGIHNNGGRRKAQLAVLLDAPVEEVALLLAGALDEEAVLTEAGDEPSIAPRSTRCCLRNIKTCTRSSSVSCRARVRSRFLRRSAFRSSLANFFF